MWTSNKCIDEKNCSMRDEEEEWSDGDKEEALVDEEDEDTR